MAFAAVMLYYKPDTRYPFARGVFGTIADPNNQHTNMGTRGGQGKNGSTGRALQIRTISFIVTIAISFLAYDNNVLLYHPFRCGYSIVENSVNK